MIFYEDFIKKVKEKEMIMEEKEYSFRANFHRLITNFLIGLPLILIGCFEIYSISENGFSFRGILSFLIMVYGIYIIYNAASYVIKLDSKEKMLKDKKIDIDLKGVKLCELKKMVAPKGKKIELCLAFYTEDKREIILPLIMRKKLEFVVILKNLLGDKFEIIEEK